jgi:hypothetical protein
MDVWEGIKHSENVCPHHPGCQNRVRILSSQNDSLRIPGLNQADTLGGRWEKGCRKVLKSVEVFSLSCMRCRLDPVFCFFRYASVAAASEADAFADIPI